MSVATLEKPSFHETSLTNRDHLEIGLDEHVKRTTDLVSDLAYLEVRFEDVKNSVKAALLAKKPESVDYFRNRRKEIEAEIKAVKAEIQGSKYLSMLTVEHITKLDDFMDYTQGIDREYKGDTLGTAVKVGSFEEDSAEWHEARANGIGGSDIAIIMGISPFKKRDALLKMKSGEVVQKANNTGGAALRGHVWENYIARKFARNNTDKTVLFSKDSWNKEGDETHKANFDGLICENGSEVPNAILEIKTASKVADWENGVPEYYRLQVLWYMDACGFKKGYLAVVINDAEYREYEIVARDGEMEEIHAKVSSFVAEVKARKEELALAA
jgi:putative phage-type endonuclease